MSELEPLKLERSSIGEKLSQIVADVMSERNAALEDAARKMLEAPHLPQIVAFSIQGEPPQSIHVFYKMKHFEVVGSELTPEAWETICRDTADL